MIPIAGAFWPMAKICENLTWMIFGARSAQYTRRVFFFRIQWRPTLPSAIHTRLMSRSWKQPDWPRRTILSVAWRKVTKRYWENREWTYQEGSGSDWHWQGRF